MKSVMTNIHSLILVFSTIIVISVGCVNNKPPNELVQNTIKQSWEKRNYHIKSIVITSSFISKGDNESYYYIECDVVIIDKADIKQHLINKQEKYIFIKKDNNWSGNEIS